MNDKLQEYHDATMLLLINYWDALVRLDELSLMLGETLRLTRIGWDDIVSEDVLKPINQIAKQIGEAMPQSIKATRVSGKL